mgnify:CR=1 FL=1
MKDGFIKVAAAAPELRVADPKFNAEKIVECVEKAREEGVKLLAFPELAITGATCGHLYYQRYLPDAALEGLKRIAEATRGDDMLVVVGLPLRARGAVYSAAAVVSGGEVCAQSGALSNPTRDTSCGTRFPAPRSASSRE